MDASAVLIARDVRVFDDDVCRRPGDQGGVRHQMVDTIPGQYVPPPIERQIGEAEAPLPVPDALEGPLLVRCDVLVDPRVATSRSDRPVAARDLDATQPHAVAALSTNMDIGAPDDPKSSIDAVLKEQRTARKWAPFVEHRLEVAAGRDADHRVRPQNRRTVDWTQRVREVPGPVRVDRLTPGEGEPWHTRIVGLARRSGRR